MKKFMAMTSIVAMLASQGHAYGQSVIGPQPNSAYTAGDMPGCHIWHVNANPFALTQAEAMRKCLHPAGGKPYPEAGSEHGG
jgi:hydrogenase/urease accessory protein HupE